MINPRTLSCSGRVFLSLVFMLLTLQLTAQTTPPGTPEQQRQVIRELDRRNIDQDELNRRLQQRGINVENASPEELLRLQPQIEAVIAEMEAEQRATPPTSTGTSPAGGRPSTPTTSTGNPTPAPATTEAGADVQEAVEAGASLDEAINETVAERTNANQPPSDIYGHQIFRNRSLQVYRASDNIRPPTTYPLRIGDQISISIFGTSQADLLLEIGTDGFIRPPQMPRIYLKDIPLGQARELLRSRFREYYVFGEGQFSANINASRTISVNIFGEVENNGTFSLSAINTAFNALVAAGGPTEEGTVRKIQLTSGEDLTLIDVYEYLQNPALTSNLYLSSNDIIYVPRAEKIVTLSGAVERPLRYELVEGETLRDLIEFGGGLRPRAVATLIEVTRYVDGAVNVINVDFTTQPDFELRDEDVVRIPVIESPVENFVSIDGAVLLPGRFAFEPGINLTTLLNQGRLRPEARRDVAFLFRRNDDGTRRLIRLDLGADAGGEAFELRRGDSLAVLSQARFTDDAEFSVDGAVRSPGTLPYPQDGKLTLEEAILLSGGLAPNAVSEAVIQRTPLNNRNERNFLRVDLVRDATIQLQPGDEVTIYNRERFGELPTVTISGAVRRTDTIPFAPELTVRDLVYLAGGLTLSANPNRVEVFRLDTENPEATRTLVEILQLGEDYIPSSAFSLRPFDQVIVRTSAAFDTIQNVAIQGEVQYPGQYALLEGVERISDLVRRAGGLTEDAFPEGATMLRRDAGGLVVLELKEAMLNTNHPSNLALRPGDVIEIPMQQEVVTILTQGTFATRFGVDELTADGAIQVAYQGNYPADWYVKNYAGGFSDRARQRWTTVEYANGQVAETGSFLGIKDYPDVRPGATIRVGLAPQRVERERREERFDWIGLAGVITGALTSVATLLIVSNN